MEILAHEMDDVLPEHLQAWWTEEQLWSVHSAAWWRRHWLDWLRVVAPDNATEVGVLEADAGGQLGYVRVVGRRRGEAQLQEPILSVPAQYVRKPLVRGSELD